MHVLPAANLACPLDGSMLALTHATLACARGHSFDVARDGYCNLLPVQHKASRDPGDGRAMVAARRRFLAAGHYDPVGPHLLAAARAVAAELNDLATALTVVDAGCGEGHHLDQLARAAALVDDQRELRLAGYDVSKWAVRAAAKRRAPVTWLVASSRRPPFAVGSVDLLLCLFGFPGWRGIRAMQRPGGGVLLADPGPEHLLELRRIIYPTVARSGPPSLAAAVAAGYRQADEATLRFGFVLAGNAAIQDLVAMTPHAHRMSAAGRAALAHVEHLEVTAEVLLRRLRLG